ncbi:tyrosine-type recombinase/integrase [Enterococcus sp. LJL128]
MVIRKEANGYSLDVSLGIDPITKKQRRIRVSSGKLKTKKEAKELEAKYLRLYHEKKLVSANSFTLEDIKEIYFDKYTTNQKASYIRSQQELYKNHIQPYFKKTLLTVIKFKQVNDFQNHLLEKESDSKKVLSKNSINKIMILLGKLFNTAIKENILTENPCRNIEKLKFQKKDMDFWTADTFKIFLNAIDEEKEPYTSLFYQVAFLTGLRAGEMIALTWKDIDFNRGEIRVNKTASLIKGKYITTEPKTANSRRYVTINSNLLNKLRIWKESQVQFLIDTFQNFDKENLLVFQYNENHPSRDFFSRRIKRIIKENDLNITPIRLHDFRHSHVALLIHNGEEPTAIKARLGHASITTTIDTYGHLYPNAQKSMSDKLNNLF